MMKGKELAFFQALLIIFCSLGVWQYTLQETPSDEGGSLIVTDSNGFNHSFQETPSRVAITNTYAASVMRMLDVDLDVIVGISGDFSDESLWPEFVNTPLVQQSAHSEIDFESLLDCRPEIYIVFATNGMVDTNAIREKLEPVGIKVVALDFYKYDVLRDEISVIAELFGKQQQATEIFDEFDAIETMVAERIDNMSLEDKPRIVMEHHASLVRDPVVLTGTSQWTDMIEKAGGVNVFADLPGHTTHVLMESIIGNNPDLLLFDGITFDIGYNSFDEENKCETHMNHVSDRDGFESVTAIVENRMAIMSGEFAGPMMIHGLPTLAKLLHPNLFLDVDTEQYLDNYFADYHDVERIGKFVCTYTDTVAD